MKEKIAIIETLIDNAEDYVKTTYELYKLKAVKKTSSIIALIISSVIFFLIAILFLIVLSFGTAIYLGEIFGRMHLGFMAVAGFYALVGIIVFVQRKSLLQTTFANMLINSFFKEKDDASN